MIATNKINIVREAIVDGGCKNVAEIMDLTGIDRVTIRKHVRNLYENEPGLFEDFKMPKFRLNRVVTPDGVVKKETKESLSEAKSTTAPERYPDSKNDEGYADPTASAAIKNVSIDYDPDQFGKIFKMTSPSTNQEDFYITIQNYGTRGILSIPMIKETNWKTNNNSAYVMTYRFEKQLYYIDVRAMYLKPAKYVVENDCGVVTKNTLMAIKTKMYRMLGFNVPETVEKIVEKVVEVPVEKIVEKKIEVPVEKIVEKKVEVPVEKVVEKVVEVPVPTNDIEQIDRALEQQRVKMELEKEKLRGDIWEEVGRSLIKALSGNEAEVM